MAQRHAYDAAAWLVRAGVFALTISSAVAVRSAAGDVASMAFVLTSYGTLLLLLACLRAYERAPPGGAGGGGRRERIRGAVWFLSARLTVMFAWRVAGVVMPFWPAAALLVWALAAITTIGGYVALVRRP